MSFSRRIKVLTAIGLWAVALTLFLFMGVRCAETRAVGFVPHGTVVKAWRNYSHGEFYYFASIEFDTEEHVHNTLTVPLSEIEYARFGREGADICLYPFGQRWRIGACTD